MCWRGMESYPIDRDAVGVFDSPSQMDYVFYEFSFFFYFGPID